MRTLLLLACAATLAAQPNVRPGTNVSNFISGIGSPFSGNRFGAFPNGQQAFGVSTTSCNVGTVNVPWLVDMNHDHPQIGMMMYREFNGRFEQISLFNGVKHGFVSTNSPGFGCGSCPGGAGTSLVVGCTDTYDAGLNYDHFWLAPPNEINPWTGLWTSRGSHFDRGFPPVAPPQDTDNVRSPINFGGAAAGHRNLVWDQGLNVTGATFYYAAVYNILGEPEANRENNWANQRFVPSWNGTQWTWSITGNHVQQPAIYRWTGATVNSATNNAGADGRFYVAVKVTGPVNGVYRYEYAVFNRDNNRQGGAVRIPVCAGATISNELFRDVDQTAGNNWTITRTATELVFTSPAGNTNNLTWGNLFNFGFDCDASPLAGNVSIDQAIAGAGNASVTVASTCPLDARNLFLGAGCGTPALPVLSANGQARLGNATFALNVRNVAAASANLMVLSAVPANLNFGACTFYIDPNQVLASIALTADGAGVVTLPIAIPNVASLDGSSFAAQNAELQAGGAFSGLLDLSSGLKVKLGILNAGCQ
jgi:hypothetical protein